MDPTLLRILHLAGVITLFTALGSIVLGNSSKKCASILHGISLVFILVIGFAILKKPPMGQYWWMAKLGLWLFLGIAPALSKRKVLPPSVVIVLCILAGVAAAWLGIRKPF